MKQISLLTLLLFGIAATAQTDTSASSSGIKLLPHQHKANFSINPDYACVRITYAGFRWKNMVGANIPLLEYDYKGHKLVALTSGYIELHDITEYQAMSWQLWRGNLGMDFYYYPKITNKKHNLGVGILLHHESQHVTDMYSFSYEFLKTSFMFDNATARSFEYRGLDVQYDFSFSSFTWYNRALIRYFTQPALLGATRQQTEAYAFETGLRYRLPKGKCWIYAHTFYEEVHNKFNGRESAYRSNWNKQPFTYYSTEAGLWITPPNSTRSANLYITWGKSNGRGLDFTKVYKDFGLGLRFNI